MNVHQNTVNGDEFQVDLAFVVHQWFLTKLIFPSAREPLHAPQVPLLEQQYVLSSSAVQHVEELMAYYADVLHHITMHHKQLDHYRFYFEICLCCYQEEHTVAVFRFDTNQQVRSFVNYLILPKENSDTWFMLDPYMQVSVLATQGHVLINQNEHSIRPGLRHLPFHAEHVARTVNPSDHTHRNA